MIVAGLATIPGREVFLKKAVNSIIDQVDVLEVALNDHEQIPGYLQENPKINAVLTSNENGDANKFLSVYGDVFFSIDDDIIYPSDYVEATIDHMRVSGASIVTYHGRSFSKLPTTSYYNGADTRVYCKYESTEYKEVQFGGTGVMAIDPNAFHFNASHCLAPNMADIWSGIEAKKQGLKVITCPKKEGWIQVLDVPDTIWHKHHKSDRYQTNLVNNGY